MKEEVAAASLWVYRCVPVLLPSSSRFEMIMSFGCPDLPTPTEQFVAGMTCASCGQPFADHVEGHDHEFVSREETV